MAKRWLGGAGRKRYVIRSKDTYESMALILFAVSVALTIGTASWSFWFEQDDGRVFLRVVLAILAVGAVASLALFYAGRRLVSLPGHAIDVSDSGMIEFGTQRFAADDVLLMEIHSEPAFGGVSALHLRHRGGSVILHSFDGIDAFMAHLNVLRPDLKIREVGSAGE